MRAVVDRDLASGGYVLQSAATKLSALEKDMGIGGAGVVDERKQQVEAVSVVGFDPRRYDCCRIGDKLIVDVTSAHRFSGHGIGARHTYHAVKLSCDCHVDGRFGQIFDRLGYRKGSLQRRIFFVAVGEPAIVTVITVCF